MRLVDLLHVQTAFQFVPIGHKDHEELEAFRDECVVKDRQSVRL